jgi:integrase
MKPEQPRFDQKSFLAMKPTGKTIDIYDPQKSGLVFRMTKTGAKTFYYVYRMGGRGSTRKWLKLGTFPSLPLIKARERARAYRAMRDAGTDPQAELKKKKFAGLTVADVVHRFIEEHVKPNLSPSSQNNYIYTFKKYTLPRIGKIPIKDLSRADVDQLISKISAEYPLTANRALAHLSSLCTKAEVWELRPQGSNPCKYVSRNPEVPRKRDIEQQELIKIGTAFRELEGTTVPPSAIAAMRVIGLCSGRISEVLSLQWNDDLHLDEGYAFVRDHKTSKIDGPKYLELPPAAVEIIRSLPREEDNPWLFPSPVIGKRLTKQGVGRYWRDKICKHAGVNDLHLHDFRSFAASEGLDQGIAPQIAAKILGHRDSRTTERHYQKVRRRATAEAAEKISAPVAKAFGLERE